LAHRLRGVSPWSRGSIASGPKLDEAGHGEGVWQSQAARLMVAEKQRGRGRDKMYRQSHNPVTCFLQ
jgi:hypothetical protein